MPRKDKGYEKVEGLEFDVPQLCTQQLEARQLEEERAADARSKGSRLANGKGSAGGGGGGLCTAEYRTMDMSVPISTAPGGLPDAATMTSWLRAQYEGHSEALETLVSEIVVDVQPQVLEEAANIVSSESTKRQELAQKYGTMYRFDAQMSEWVFFHTKVSLPHARRRQFLFSLIFLTCQTMSTSDAFNKGLRASRWFSRTEMVLEVPRAALLPHLVLPAHADGHDLGGGLPLYRGADDNLARMDYLILLQHTREAGTARRCGQGRR